MPPIQASSAVWRLIIRCPSTSASETSQPRVEAQIKAETESEFEKTFTRLVAGRSEAVAAKTGVAEANAADDELPLVDRDETAAPKPHKESRGPAGPPLIDRAMHLLVALLPILLGTVRWYASVDAYPVSLFAGKA